MLGMTPFFFCHVELAETSGRSRILDYGTNIYFCHVEQAKRVETSRGSVVWYGDKNKAST